MAWSSCNPDSAFDRSAAKYGLDPILLYSIALVESKARPMTIARNKNGSIDHGAMQINSVHLPALERVGIRRDDLFDPCVNVDVGAWVLRQCFDRWGMNWDAVGCYNSNTIPHRRIYAAKVQTRYDSLTRRASALAKARPQATAREPSATTVGSARTLICAQPSGCLVEIGAKPASPKTSPLVPPGD